MNVISKTLITVCLLSAAAACHKEGAGGSAEDEPQPVQPIVTGERIILLNEGNWQSDNGQLSFIENHNITNGWFKSVNGVKLGDTPQHIIALNDTLLAVSINWSNIIQYIKPDGRLVASTENVPNCRYMATDGSFLYITSYAHETALGEKYSKGYVAKVSVSDFTVKATCEVGYEPEGIALYKGKLYVANSGGYAFSEGHDYENTISIVNAASMQKEEDVPILSDNGERVLNLYGNISQSGRYLCINSCGDYYSVPAATVIFDCEDNSYTVYDFPSTCNTVLQNGWFFTVGSSFSYDTYESIYCYNTVDPVSGDVFDCYLLPDFTAPTDVLNVLDSMENPYCVYQNPYSGHLYITDACSYSSAGKVYEFDECGILAGEPLKCYINPGHMIALP